MKRETIYGLDNFQETEKYLAKQHLCTTVTQSGNNSLPKVSWVVKFAKNNLY